MAENDDKKDTLAEMKRKMAVLEWDLNRNQINPAMRAKYQQLKEEATKLEQEISQ